MVSFTCKYLVIIFLYEAAKESSEPYWSNTIKGNRHHRIMSLEKVVSCDGIVAFVVYAGKHRIQWSKLAPKVNE